MEIRSNSITPVFVIGFLIVLVAGHFYNPFEAMVEQYSLMNELGSDMRSDFLKMIVPVIIPPLVSLSEIIAYMRLTGNGSYFLPTPSYIAVCLICFIYAVLIYFIERAHSAMHEDENPFTICVNMLCMENILMYIFNIAAYFIYRTVTSFRNIPRLVSTVFLLTIGVIVLILMFVNLVYSFLGGFIILLPSVLISIYGPQMSILLDDIVTVIVMLFMSQVVWRSCSNVIFKKLLSFFSFGMINIDW